MKTISELLEQNHVNMLELCLRTNVSYRDVAGRKPEEQIRIMAEAIRDLPDREIRRMLGLTCIRFFLRKLRSARGMGAVIPESELDKNILLQYGIKTLMTLGYAQWLDISEEYMVSHELLSRMGPFEEGELGELRSADDMLETALGLCDLCGCISMDRLIGIMGEGVEKELTEQQHRNIIEGLVKLALQRIGGASVIRVETENGETRTFLKHPEFDVAAMGSERYFLRQAAVFTAKDALFRLKTGLVAGNPWYGHLLEAMFPSDGLLEKVFASSAEMDPDGWLEEMEHTAAVCIGDEASLVISMLCEMTENVAWMLPTNPGSDLYGYIECLVPEPGRDIKRAESCVNMLEATLPRWTLMGFSMEEEQDRVRHDLLRETGMDGKNHAFRALCPCGSGKIYGKCHGRFQ